HPRGPPLGAARSRCLPRGALGHAHDRLRRAFLRARRRDGLGRDRPHPHQLPRPSGRGTLTADGPLRVSETAVGSRSMRNRGNVAFSEIFVATIAAVVLGVACSSSGGHSATGQVVAPPAPPAKPATTTTTQPTAIGLRTNA